ncbi:membrane protein [Psychrosphaera saromensis]|uniref:TonB-dependent receptor n=1 Tax=Psychrosphaera saromensis TaxID=716813 RepID=A0A2S7UZB9_9GAMM|nr:TonB-dependent receptor [Psychrosphaera saromensis]PQJ54631.1 TonB-dependent receptor [Psychrosphaera saromensis]GHB58464.1 membrane protein [Psychrosphaera saromensis]GLQ14149.1 membrane protein [Psychrosphaera saromensis]
MKNFRNSLTAFAVAAALGLSSTAMAADTGGLKIKVTDKNGNAIAGATVLAKAPDSLVSKTAVSDADGYVTLRGLDASNQYTVSINGSDIQSFEASNVRVITGKSLNLSYSVSGATSSMETITVSGRAISAIDTTSATTGMDITLDMTESLPTGRSYQSYLQLTPGVKPSSSGNPSSKSGVNYSDVGGSVGTSSDNIYYIDGVNVTDNSTGTAGGNINSEIIQEQQVITGAVPAKYAGGAGLVSRVVTKSGSNEFHGSVNYYLQNDSLVGDYDSPTKADAGFSTFDTAVTLGGPIIKDELWFFASYQIKNKKTDVTDPVTGDFSRAVEDESTLGFGKLTWQATEDDRLVFTFFNDPRDISGSSAFDTLSNRDRVTAIGGNNLKLDYSHAWDDLIINTGVMSHESELSYLAKDTSTRNDVAFYTNASSATQSETDLGGLGAHTLQDRNKSSFYINAEYYLDTDDFGYHTIEVGYEAETNENITNSVYTGDSAQYTSIAAADSGVTFNDYITNDDWVGTKDLGSADIVRLSDELGITEADVSNIVFNSTEGNPTGDVNAYRIMQTEQAESKLETKGQTFYIQDSITIDDLTLNVGLRAEKWEHFASTGANIFTFDWEVAHRLSAVYDINGDGDSKVWAFIGRYYDPIRTDMTSFAGNLTGSVREEQIFVNGNWETFRTRGGVATQDAFISPATKTPYTDEFLIGYSTNLTEDTNISVTYTKRDTKDIMEDYDLSIYSEDGYLAGTDFELPYSYFGYTENPGSNYVIGTLAGGKRVYQGIEVTFKKLRTENWSLLSSYTYNDAEGSSNSDGNADFQGDWEILDPRAPNMYGKQPGNVEHQFKILGTYYFDNGFEAGAIYNWNSGTRYSKAQSISGRYLPLQVETAYEFGGYTTEWVDTGSVGVAETPSYGTLDVRVKYVHDFGDYQTEFFLDIFNVLDDQAITEEEQLAAGSGTYAFGEAKDWVEPRRFYLGAKVLF